MGRVIPENLNRSLAIIIFTAVFTILTVFLAVMSARKDSGKRKNIAIILIILQALWMVFNIGNTYIPRLI
jgi:lipopolysaccharide export LptBFGC system permease protein LptF